MRRRYERSRWFLRDGLILVVVVEARDHGQRQPLRHSGLPHRRFRADDVEPEQIVDLFEAQDFGFARTEQNVPEVGFGRLR